MIKLDQITGIRAQTAFEMLYGAKPSLKGMTITGTLVFVGYGNDRIDDGIDYINLSKNRPIGVNTPGFYINISEGKNDIEMPTGEMIFMKHGFDYLGSSDWSQLNIINLIMGKYGKRTFEWYGQINGKEKTTLPYMAISVEPDFTKREFFICEAAAFLIEEYMIIKKQKPLLIKQ